MKGVDLLKLRKEAGLSQMGLARIIGRSDAWVNRREKKEGERYWSPITMEDEKLIKNAISKLSNGKNAIKHKIVIEEDDATTFDKPNEVAKLKEEIEDMIDSIASHCIQCMGPSIKEIRHCEEIFCHLWQYRPFQKNDTK